DHERDEEGDVGDEHDRDPGAHHEPERAEERPPNGGGGTLERGAGLPGLRESMGEAEEELALAGDAEVPPVLADERVHAPLSIAEREAALGGGVGDGEVLPLAAERALERAGGIAGIHQPGGSRRHSWSGPAGHPAMSLFSRSTGRPWTRGLPRPRRGNPVDP